MKPFVSIETKTWGPVSVGKILLVSGLLSSFLYAVADFWANDWWKEYDFFSQSVSELEGISSPARPLLVSLFTAYSALIILFGGCMVAIHLRKPSIRWMGILIVGYGLMGELALLFFPIHQRGELKTSSDSIHMALTTVTVLCMLLTILLGANINGRKFRIYSYLTMILLLLFGILSGLDGRRIVLGHPTPWLGIKERINIYGYMAWIGVLACVLFRKAEMVQ